MHVYSGLESNYIYFKIHTLYSIPSQSQSSDLTLIILILEVGIWIGCLHVCPTL